MKIKITLFVCCIFVFENLHGQVFEGSITYKVDVTPLIENHKHNEYFAKRWGDEMTIYHDEKGNQLRKFVNSGGVEYQLYNNEENRFYSKFVGYDTLYFYSCATNIFDSVTFDEEENRKILEYQCKSLLKTEIITGTDDTISTKMFYSEKLPIAWKKYEQFKDGHLDKVYSKIRSHLLWYDIRMKEYLVEFEAINIDERKLDESLFKVPDNIPMKQI